jgi:hypothetical protein
MSSSIKLRTLYHVVKQHGTNNTLPHRHPSCKTQKQPHITIQFSPLLTKGSELSTQYHKKYRNSSTSVTSLSSETKAMAPYHTEVERRSTTG